MWRSSIAWGLLLGSSCASGQLRGDLFSKGTVSYRVVAPRETEWKPVSFSDNDLAWLLPTTRHVVAVNATCEGHEDPPLEVLTRHLLVGFTDKVKLETAGLTLDGREGLRTIWRAQLDGVSVELELVVLKKNGCVHDFTYVSPLGQRGAHQAEFDALVSGFAQRGVSSR